jgi:hypothetical protein
MVDDAHATGVLGQGLGTAAHFGLTDQMDLKACKSPHNSTLTIPLCLWYHQTPYRAVSPVSGCF